MSDSHPSTPLLEKKKKEDYQTMSQHLSPIPTIVSSISDNDADNVITSTPLPSDVESGRERDDRKNLSSIAGYSSMDDRISDQDTNYQSDVDLTTGILKEWSFLSNLQNSSI